MDTGVDFGETSWLAGEFDAFRGRGNLIRWRFRQSESLSKATQILALNGILWDFSAG
jgi:hypothetical protein